MPSTDQMCLRLLCEIFMDKVLTALLCGSGFGLMEGMNEGIGIYQNDVEFFCCASIILQTVLN